MNTKVCTKCGRELPLSEYKKRKHGLSFYCKECIKLYPVEDYNFRRRTTDLHRKELMKKYYEVNKDKILTKKRISISDLHDSYIKGRLAQKIGCSCRDVPVGLIEFQRAILATKRELKQYKTI